MNIFSLFYPVLSFGALIASLTLTMNLHAAPRFAATPQPHSDFTCAGVSEIPAQECEALVAIAPRPAFGGDELDWFTSDTPCNWFGVYCENGHIIRLDLSGKNIEATLPPELGNLAELAVLKITGAEVGLVSGSIPPELGNLMALRELVIHSNLLSGAIPPELGNLSNLETLNLYGNNLSGPIPAELGQLLHLESLILGVEVCGGGRCANELSGPLPPSLGNLSNLRELLIAGNGSISGEIPQSFVSLEALEEFSFSGTSLCEPDDESFQTWIESVPDYNGTNVTCAASPTYSITGRILDAGGAPVTGVMLSIDSADPARSDLRATTGASGLYEFTDLAAGTYTLTAAHERYVFAPPAMELTVPPARLQQNFQAAAKEATALIYLPIVSQSGSTRR